MDQCIKVVTSARQSVQDRQLWSSMAGTFAVAMEGHWQTPAAAKRKAELDGELAEAKRKIGTPTRY